MDERVEAGNVEAVAEEDAKGFIAWLGRLLARPATQRFITTLIVINAIVLGLETSATAMAAAGPYLILLDGVILAVFVVELLAKFAVQRGRFFRDGWNIFDSLVVGIALLPAGGNLSVLRALRILRVLRLVSTVPSMRRVVSALMRAIPGMGSILSLLVLVFYVASVMATKLFGAAFPEWFGTIGASAYSLFQIMTLESWSMEIVRPVMEVYPQAWAFFVPFILVTSFAVLNLFIGIVVDAMHKEHAAEEEAEAAKQAKAQRDTAATLEEVKALRVELAAFREGLAKREGA
jgi:voltage-gated sodium channel